jgi:hypothetical protein
MHSDEQQQSNVQARSYGQASSILRVLVMTQKWRTKMKLVYTETGTEVKVGDIADTGRGELVEVVYFRQPHKPSSSGKVSVKTVNTDRPSEYFVGVIGAEWINREDRGEV